MIFISHRGNIYGPNKNAENQPDYIRRTLLKGYEVEMDVWVVNGDLFLGHDKPMYTVGKYWFDKRVCDLGWLHCKNQEAYDHFKKNFNCFIHDKEPQTITSRGYVWSYPGNERSGTICVLPENDNRELVDGLVGICSDYIGRY
jgi:hypothetical protein